MDVTGTEIPLRILLIEDNPASARLIQEMLRDVQDQLFELTVARSLREGIELSRDAQVALLDLGLPESTGLETFFEARDKIHIPIVVVSGHSDEAVALEAVTAGAQDYLVKGRFGGDALARVVRYAVERHRLLDRERQIEQALRESEERYRRFFEEDLTGDCRVSADGTLLECNPAFAKIFGFENAERAQGTSFWSLFAEPATSYDFLRELRESGRVELFEIRGHRLDGEDVVILGNAVASRDADGDLAEFLAYLFDDTARKEAESQLRQAQKMDAIGRLAGGVAHDFSNILTAIGFHAELLLRDLADDERLCRRARDIKLATKRASSLTSRLLAFSRRQVLRPTRLDLNEIVADVIGLFQRVIGEDVQFVERLSEDTVKVEADPSQLEQVIINLVINARDAMPGGGRLTLETEVVEVSGEDGVPSGPAAPLPPGPYAMVAVSDTGEGIDPTIRDRIFEPFFTTKRPSRGTGLGLSTVRGIVREGKGEVTFESVVGQGTTFRVYLPKVRDRAKTTSFLEPSSITTVPGSGTLLVAEDDATVRDLVIETLESQGFKVLGAASGKKALEISDNLSGDIDLLITDVIMPDRRGPDLVAAVKARRPRMKVLYMSGFIDDATLRRSVESARVAFLAKPFSAAELIVKVWEVLEGAAVPEIPEGSKESGAPMPA